MTKRRNLSNSIIDELVETLGQKMKAISEMEVASERLEKRVGRRSLDRLLSSSGAG